MLKILKNIVVQINTALVTSYVLIVQNSKCKSKEIFLYFFKLN